MTRRKEENGGIKKTGTQISREGRTEKQIKIKRKGGNV
jgi:hypothetical protein